MAKKVSKKESKMKNEAPREITFKCQSCGQYKSIEEMKAIKRFFPVLVVCSDCERYIH